MRIEDGPGRFGDVSVGLGLFFAPWRGAAAKRALTHVIVAGASRGACGGDDADPNRELAGVSAGHRTPLAGSSLIDPLQVLRFRWTESGQVDSCISALFTFSLYPELIPLYSLSLQHGDLYRCRVGTAATAGQISRNSSTK